MTERKKDVEGHALVRTNKIGEDFIGRCINCGAEGLRIQDMYAGDGCPNPAGRTQGQNLAAVLRGDMH